MTRSKEPRRLEPLPPPPSSDVAFFLRGAVLGRVSRTAALFLRPVAGASASPGCFLREGTRITLLQLCCGTESLQSLFWSGSANTPYYSFSPGVKPGRGFRGSAVVLSRGC